MMSEENPLAKSPIFAALIHAATKAKDAKQSNNGSDPESFGEDFELDNDNHSTSGDDGSAGSFRRKRVHLPEQSEHIQRRAHSRKRPKGSVTKMETAEMPRRKGSVELSKGGSSCHQCKSRRSFRDLTYCTSNLDNSKKKTCRKKYCEHCLSKFYKEAVASERQKASWVCPSCRKICCCAACRRKEHKDRANAGVCRAPRPSSSGTTVDYEAVLDFEEMRLMQIAQDLRAVPPGSVDGAGVQRGSRSGQADMRVDPPLDTTLTYMMALVQFDSVKEMIRRITDRQGTNPHEKVQLISVLLRRIHQKYAGINAQRAQMSPESEGSNGKS